MEKPRQRLSRTAQWSTRDLKSLYTVAKIPGILCRQVFLSFTLLIIARTAHTAPTTPSNAKYCGSNPGHSFSSPVFFNIPTVRFSLHFSGCYSHGHAHTMTVGAESDPFTLNHLSACCTNLHNAGFFLAHFLPAPSLA